MLAGRQPLYPVDVSRAVGLLTQSGGPLFRLLFHPPSSPLRPDPAALSIQPQPDTLADGLGLRDIAIRTHHPETFLQLRADADGEPI